VLVPRRRPDSDGDNLVGAAESALAEPAAFDAVTLHTRRCPMSSAVAR